MGSHKLLVKNVSFNTDKRLILYVISKCRASNGGCNNENVKSIKGAQVGHTFSE